MGPPLGGAVTQYSSWRVLFWINLPICLIAGVLVVGFMKMKAPVTTFQEKMHAMDWM